MLGRGRKSFLTWGRHVVYHSGGLPCLFITSRVSVASGTSSFPMDLSSYDNTL